MTSGIARISASEIIGLKDNIKSHPVSDGRMGERIKDERIVKKN